MTLSELLAAARSQVFGGALDPVARFAWCREQRRHLEVPGPGNAY